MFSFAVKHTSDSVGSGFIASRTAGAALSVMASALSLGKYGIRAAPEKPVFPVDRSLTFDAATNDGQVIDPSSGNLVGSFSTTVSSPLILAAQTVGEFYSLPSTAFKDGYDFLGWWCDDLVGNQENGGFVYESTLMADIFVSNTDSCTLKAVFSSTPSSGSQDDPIGQTVLDSLFKPVLRKYGIRTSYTVDEANGSEPYGVDVVFPSGKYSDLDYTPTWTGHRFYGWYTSPSTPSVSEDTSGVEVSKSDRVDYNVPTIYARWQIPKTVVFDATTEGGSMNPWSHDYYAGQEYGELPTASKSGQVFLGWFVNGSRITASSIVPTGSGSVTLVAKYASVTYDTSFQVTTTSSYRNTGIYSATSRNSSNPTIVNWGDGAMDVVYGNISQLVHTYSSNGTFTVQINNNISSLALSYNDSTWYGTTSQNRYTVKSVLSLSSNITSVPSYAFYYCAVMTAALLPASATSVPAYCFYYCQYLMGITIPSSCTSIGNYAFYNCRSASFTSVTIPASVTSIGSYGFGYCQYLRNITFASSSSTLSLGTYAFAYCFYQSPAVGTIDLSPRKITSLPNYCFYYCRYLKGITWPQNLTSIGGYTFRYCFYYSSSTGTVSVPEGVTSFSSTYAFANCSYLTAITLPSTLTNLNNYTFYFCTRLATITCNRSTAPTVSAATFGNNTTYYTGRTNYSAGTNKLYVPSGATGYTSSYWGSVLLDSTKCGFTLVNIQTYTVTFDANGGTGTMSPQTFTAGVAQNLTANAFTKELYVFNGWNTAADESGTSYSNGESYTATGDVILYAKWKLAENGGGEGGSGPGKT